MDNDPIEQEILALKEGYLTALPDNLSEMRRLLVQIQQQPATDLIKKLQLFAHRIKGTAATYGFLAIGERAGELEQGLAKAQTQPDFAWDQLDRQLNALQQAIALARDEHSDAGSTSNQSDQGHVLIVDDDPDFLRLMSALLRQKGFRISTTTDPKAVLGIVKDKHPELLLIDVEMPEMSGYQLCRLLREDAHTRELPIIFLTAHDTQDYRNAAFQAGGDDFINKPIVSEELLARVGVRLARARLIREKQAMLRQLQDQHESLLSILNQLQIGTVMIDSDGKILFMSQSCQMLWGLLIEKAIGQPWQRVLPFDQKAVHNIANILHGKMDDQPRFQIDWHRAGKHFFVDCQIREVPARPGVKLLYLYDQSELHQLKREIEQSRFHQMLGNSEPMRQMYGLIEQVARGDWNVLIEGETGVGKELVAHSIHAASPRKDHPFIAVNSAGLSETLLSSQLFGHRRGAFTGAVADQEGFFEAASGGTLFLDEIGDIPLPMQAALLRVLQEKEIIRLGESRTRKVDVRIIAATHKDLAGEVRAGRFREDLLYRLRVARVYVPALRERKADIPMLAQAFLTESCRAARVPLKHIGSDAMYLLQTYDWPGNVRELKAIIDYAVIRSRGDQLSTHDLPPELIASTTSKINVNQAQPHENRLEASGITPLIPSGEVDERQRILNALAQAGGKRLHAAKLLGISRATFYRRLAELGITLDQ
ncbi:MAG: sigma 54-interacting transcriptional regulator [Gammaproteobacteria bacterium]